MKCAAIRTVTQLFWISVLFSLILLEVFQSTSAFTTILSHHHWKPTSHATVTGTTTTFRSMSSSNTNNDEKPKVVVVGSANQDLTSYTGVVPVLGQTVMGQSFDTSCGGKGANQAVAAASLGMVPVSMICRVADDVFGKSLLTNFRK